MNAGRSFGCGSSKVTMILRVSSLAHLVPIPTRTSPAGRASNSVANRITNRWTAVSTRRGGMGEESENGGSPGGRRRAAHPITAREWLLLLVLSAVQFTHIVDF